MGMLERISDAIRRPRKSVSAYQETSDRIFVNPLCSTYENLFAQVQPYINDMKSVFPYGRGANGAPLSKSRTPELTALLNPNEDMGWDEFISLVIATWLTEKEVNIHVWKNSRGRVYGYSVLPLNCRKVNLSTGEDEFIFTNYKKEQVKLTNADVFTMRYSRSPSNFSEGVSPATSIFVYTQLDDLIAQYQRAYFENGAVPAQIAFIRASSYQKYQDVRRDLESNLHGSKNKNKTLFVWRQFDNDDGSEKDQIEYKTIQSNNSTLALKEIMSIVSDKSNKAFGVSNFILGDDSSAKYDNAELSRQQFLEHRIYPALQSFWNQFQHGLDRVLGGLGYSIDFDLEIPEITERKKARAEISKVEFETLYGMIQAGANPIDSINALGLTEEWIPAAKSIYNRALSATAPILEDKKPIQKNKDKNMVQVTSSQKPVERTRDDSDIYIPKFGEGEGLESAIYDNLMKIAEAIAESNDLDSEEVVNAIIQLLVDSADDGAKAGAEGIAKIAPEEVSEEIKVALENDGFHVSDEFNKKLEDRVTDLAKRFEESTRAVVEKVLLENTEMGLTAKEIADKLDGALPRYRAEQIARNEVVHAFRAGRLETDDYIANKYGLKIKKVWQTAHDHKVCPICAAMDGKAVELNTAFVDSVVIDSKIYKQMEATYGSEWLNQNNIKIGDSVGWEHSEWNNYGEVPSAHTNCRCSFNEELE